MKILAYPGWNIPLGQEKDELSVSYIYVFKVTTGHIRSRILIEKEIADHLKASTLFS